MSSGSEILMQRSSRSARLIITPIRVIREYWYTVLNQTEFLKQFLIIIWSLKTLYLENPSEMGNMI